MKRFLTFCMAFIAIAFVTAPAANALAAGLGVSPLAASIGLIAFASIGTAFVSPGSFHMADVQVEIWNKWIAENIYKNNDFLQRSHNADDNVLAGKVVHIPQSGAASAVVKNRSALPATVAKRTDTDVTYPLDEFTTDPRLIPDADKAELSYDKLASVMKDDMGALRQTVAENMLINWAPATNILRTTGAAVAAHSPSATGNRAAFGIDEFTAAMTFLNAQDAPEEGRCALLDATMYGQLVKSMTASQYRDFVTGIDPKTGVIGKLMGFDVYRRSTVLTYNNAGTPVVKAYGAAGATTDNAAVLFWHEDGVERALGEVKTFSQDNAPQYYGDLMSFLLRAGGRKRRADEKFVVAVVQAAV